MTAASINHQPAPHRKDENMTECQKCSLRIFLLIVFALAVACWALAALPQAAKTSTQPGCINYRAGEEPLLNVPACRKAAIHAQTVKPALPADAHLNQFHSSPGTFAVTYQQMTTSTKTTNLMMQPQCGWQGRERDDKRCELIITAPADYDDFKCTTNPRGKGDPYVGDLSL